MAKYSKLPRIYLADSYMVDKEITITEEKHRYLQIVLRSRAGDLVRLFNGQVEFEACIINIGKKQTILRCQKLLRDHQEASFSSCIIPIMKNDKISRMVKDATELGAARIIIVDFEFCQSKMPDLERLQKISIEAAEQCERLDIPEILGPISLKDILEYRNVTLIWANEAQKNFINLRSKLANDNNEIITMIGPEGGFSKREQELLAEYENVISISLGKNVLRTETALVATLFYVNAILQER